MSKHATAGALRVGRIAGIPLRIQRLWFVIVVVLTWTLGAGYYRDEVPGIAPVFAYGLGLASVLLLFASIVLHELSHSLVARRAGVEIEEIDLWLLGGVARMRGGPRRAADELRIALAGPAASVAIAVVFAVAAALVSKAAAPALHAVLVYQAIVNALIVGFNLLPAFPMDGGRVAHALFWRRSRDEAAATALAVKIGRVFAYVFIGLGVVEVLGGGVAGLWLAMVGVFVLSAGAGEAAQASIARALAHVPARSLMSSPLVAIRSELSVAQAVSEFFNRYRFTAFPVLDRDGRVAGLLSIAAARAVPAVRRLQVRVGDVAVPDPLIVGVDDDVIGLLSQPAFARDGRAIVVDAGGKPVGLLSITDVQRALRAAELAA